MRSTAKFAARVLDQANYAVGCDRYSVAGCHRKVFGGAGGARMTVWHWCRQKRKVCKSQLVQYEKLYEKGLIKITDLLDAQVRRDTILADEIEQTNQLEVAREALVKMTSKPIGKLDRLNNQSMFPKVEGNAEDWIGKAQKPTSLMARRMSVLAAEAGARQAYGVYASRWICN